MIGLGQGANKKYTVKYLFVLVSIIVVWIAQLVIAAIIGDTNDRFDLYLITITFTFMLYLLGFLRRA